MPIHFRNKLQCGFNNKQVEEGEATVQERSGSIQEKEDWSKEKNNDISTIWGPFAGIETTLHKQFYWIPQRTMTILIIQRVNLLMILKVPKLVRISLCSSFSVMETLDGRSSISFF